MNVSSKLRRSFAKRGHSPIVRFSFVGLVVAGFIHLPTQVDRAIGQRQRFAIELPLVPPIVSSDLTSAPVDVQEEQPVRLTSAQIALKEAEVAVSLSQAQLAQARMNLSEFQTKHNSAKILTANGRVTRQQIETTKIAYDLAKLQHRSAEIGLRESHAQLIAAKAEASKLGCIPNSLTKM